MHSRQAIEALEVGGYLERGRNSRIRVKYSMPAALTYVAATLTAILLQLLRLMMISGLFGRRRND